MKSDFSVFAFWALIIFVLILVVVFYLIPADKKLNSLEKLYKNTQQKNSALDKELENLRKELKAFDDPFYIEKLLRCEYNWKSENSNEIFLPPVFENDFVPLPLYDQ